MFNHNIETAERFYRRVRPRGDYRKALGLLDQAKDVWAELFPAAPPLLTKSGIIVGMGETNQDVVEIMRDLRDHRVDVVTIGQYLQPSDRHLPLDRWVTPAQFRWMREQGEAIGFGVRVRRAAGAIELPCRRAAPGRERRLAGRGALTTGGYEMVPEAPMEDGPDGRKTAGEGWFIVNARETPWIHNEKFGAGVTFEGSQQFPHYGINVQVVWPGQPNCYYHAEEGQEDFLV